ncbi:DUF6377 domain-containing protein [Parabacteroides sp. FAFU027]|uniref:DUF6377 domain-containing protein n=1 Tax=Parabacteroides sp. FAFU027 TaxID=2922715 RepID=UPI001FAE82D0|nr:DUF6377 domain-containing protein [Parabacteroides sp. FAFU027]
MKKLFSVLLLFMVVHLAFANHERDSLLNVLDNTIANCPIYSARKEARLNKLKVSLRKATSDSLRYAFCGLLYDEYKTYSIDSSLIYAQRKLDFAEKLKDKRKITDSRLNVADGMMSLGRIKSTFEILAPVNIDSYPEMKSYYYHIRRTSYEYLSNLSISRDEKKENELQIDKYRDSLILSGDDQSSVHIMVNAAKWIAAGRSDQALKSLPGYFYSLRPDDHNRAIVAFIISQAYHEKKDRQQEEKWLMVSAIYDLQAVYKNYISLRSLAFMLYEDGDYDRAYTYMKQALEDAIFCKAYLRTIEISKMMPVIDKAYQLQNDAEERHLVIFLIVVSVLAILLLIGGWILYLRQQKIKRARKELSQANEQLVKLNQEMQRVNDEMLILNDDLSEANLALRRSNESLSEVNMIKEEYVGKYMEQCSIYIHKLEEYRKQLIRKSAAGKIEDLIQAVKSEQFIKDELHSFYANFDRTFLRIFPHFVEEFNSLLADGEGIYPKPGELLGTELRIYALIRLGITDSAKISHFLRYSLNTIYNYRTRIRNKAVGSRETFEERVMTIGLK